MDKQVKRTKGHLTVTLALTKLPGNKLAYFSATAELRNPKTGRIESCGCMHEEILAAFPEFADFVALHLADEHGAPMHAEANGYYWLAGALGGLGERYHGGNRDNGAEKSREECLKIFAEHVRITTEQADALIDSFKGGQAAVRPQFADWVAQQRSRWAAEAHLVTTKYFGSQS